MIYRALAALIIFFFLSCKEDNHLFILFDKADGLTKTSNVLFNGMEIGSVEEISLNSDYEILVKCLLNEKTNIPVDSEIKLKAIDILGTKSISIKSGTSLVKFRNNDTLHGLFEDINIIDTVLTKGSGIINDAISDTQIKIDTLTKELKKTNELLGK